MPKHCPVGFQAETRTNVSRRNIATQQPSEELKIERDTWGYFVNTPDCYF